MAAGVGTLVFSPPSRLFGIACDVFSLPHLLAVVLASLTLVVLRVASAGLDASRWSCARIRLRPAGPAPKCLDPYADVDPLLRRLQLPNVAEAQSVVVMLREMPGFALAILIPGDPRPGLRGVEVAKGRLGHGRMVSDQSCDGRRLLGSIHPAHERISAATALSVPVLGVVFVRIRSRIDALPLLVAGGTDGGDRPCHLGPRAVRARQHHRGPARPGAGLGW